MKAQHPLIDCDIHCNPCPENPLLPFVHSKYRLAIDLKMAAKPSGGYANPFGVNRRDVEGLLPEQIIESHLDRYGVTHAIIQPQSGTTFSLCHAIDMGNALCQAINDWLVATVLEKDERFFGSICVNTNDPKEAAREIHRAAASHPRMVQVNVAGESTFLYGHRFYDPIYEACEELGLVFALHPGSEGAYHSSTPVGRPSTYFEWHVGLPITFMAHAASLVLEGTFEKFPGLMVLLTEGGYGWLPHLMWRMDKDFKALRTTTPWLKEEPSATIRKHIRLTTQPVEEVPDPRHAATLLEMIDARQTLCFSSDFPHWDFDDPFRAFPSSTPADVKQRILWGNARELYSRRISIPEPANCH